MNGRRKAIQLLKENGYVFECNGGNHDKYYNASIKKTIMLKRHNFDENDVKYIEREIEQNKKATEKTSDKDKNTVITNNGGKKP